MKKIPVYSAVLALLSLVLIVRLAWGHDLSPIWSFDLKYALLVVGLSLGSLICWILSVQEIFAAVGRADVPLQQTFFVCLSSFVGGALTWRPTAVGTRAFMYKDIMRIPMQKAAGCLGLEVVVRYGVTVLIIFASAGMLMAPRAYGVLAATTVFAVILIYAGLKMPFAGKIRIEINAAKKTRILIAAVWMLFSSFLHALVFYFLFYPQGYRLDIGALMASCAICSVATAVSLMPFGLGLFDVSFIGLAVIQGVSRQDALNAVILHRLLNNVGVLLVAWFAALVLSHKALKTAA